MASLNHQHHHGQGGNAGSSGLGGTGSPGSANAQHLKYHHRRAALLRHASGTRCPVVTLLTLLALVLVATLNTYSVTQLSTGESAVKIVAPPPKRLNADLLTSDNKAAAGQPEELDDDEEVPPVPVAVGAKPVVELPRVDSMHIKLLETVERARRTHVKPYRKGPPSSSSSKDNHLLTVLVMSRRDAFQNRQAIREAWGSEVRAFGFTLRFVVGERWCQYPEDLQAFGHPCELISSPPSDHVRRTRRADKYERAVQQEIWAEQGMHGDMLVLKGLTDSYGGLANKTVQALVTAALELGSKPEWILKVDDDAVLRPSRLLAALLELEGPRNSTRMRIMGDMRENVDVMREGKWAEFKFKPDKYPTYPQGASGYLVERDFAEALAPFRNTVPLYTCEDAAIGMWVLDLKLDVDLVLDTRFQTFCHINCCMRVVRNAPKVALDPDPTKRDRRPFTGTEYEPNKRAPTQQPTVVGGTKAPTYADDPDLHPDMPPGLEWVWNVEKIYGAPDHINTIVYGHRYTPVQLSKCTKGLQRAEYIWDHRHD